MTAFTQSLLSDVGLNSSMNNDGSEYGDLPSDDHAADDAAPVGASIGSGQANPKANLIEQIMHHSTMQTPAGPSIETPTTKTTKHDPEELAQKTVWELRRILRDEKVTIPLSARFNREDRILAARSEEYKEALQKLEDPDEADVDSMEPIDLTG
jgi:hypothetical protein